MAVAVKNREATSAGVFDRLPVAIVAGVLYVLIGLGILFPLANLVWWLTGLPWDSPVGWLALLVADGAVAVGLVVVGRRFLAAHRQLKGVRAGIVLGVVGVLTLLLVTDWVGGQLADMFFRNGWQKEFGLVLTIAFGLATLILGGRYFLSDAAAKFLVALEEQGWFSAQSYKRNQGVRVRRGTILGILILTGTGIWVAHQGLMKQGSNASWVVGVPFTAKVPITWQNVGDNPVLREQLENGPGGRAEEGQKELSARWHERRDQALGTFRAAKYVPPEVRDRLRDLTKGEKGDAEVADLLKTLEAAPARPAGADTALSTEERENLDKAVATLREPEPGPTLYKDRFDLRDLNKAFTATYVKVVDPGTDPYPDVEPNTGYAFKAGAVVPTNDKPRPDDVVGFDPQKPEGLLSFAVQQKLRQDKHDKLAANNDRKADADLVVPPKDEKVTAAAEEPVEYDRPQGIASPTRVLLPHVAYTLPVLLAALALWFAWRCVNVPAFADFLIATEAELNKVSWTTRKRLWQDTIVVLVTVLLMALALFVADVVWSRVLTMIGVLQPPPPSSERMQEQPW
jgi:preprotein translocase SecE subunit